MLATVKLSPVEEVICSFPSVLIAPVMLPPKAFAIATFRSLAVVEVAV